MPRRVEWVRLASEGAVIVVSILLAFAVDALWDVRGDRQAEQVLLAALEQDMLRNQREAERVLSVIEVASTSTRAFLAADPQALHRLSRDSAQAFRLLGRGVPTFDASDGSIRNRDLSLLRDDQLLDALGEWSQELGNLEEGGTIALERSGLTTLRGARIAPDFFLEELVDPEDLSRLRSDEEFVAIQISLESTRYIISLMVGGLAERTDTVLEQIRRHRR